MKGRCFPIVCIALTACGAHEPLDLRRYDEAERRFAAPSPRDETGATRDLLRKPELTLEEVLAIADGLNPSLASERKNVDLATAALWEARLYPNPALLLRIEDYRTEDGATTGKMERVAGLRFPIVLGGRIGAASTLADKEREIAAVQYVWRRREILGEVKRAFLRVLASRRNGELARGTRDIARNLRDVSDARFKAQAVPEMELLKAEVNLAKAEADLRLAEKDIAVSLKSLQALLGDADFPNEKFTGELFGRFSVPSLEALRGHVPGAHPLLEAAKMRRAAAELELDLAKAERIPDMAFEFTAGRDPEGDTILEGGLEIPLPIFNRNQAKIARAEIRIRKSELEIQVARNGLLVRLTEAYRTFVAAQERATIYRDEILPKAQKALDQTQEGYRLGKFGHLDLLDAQRTLADARFADAAVVAELNLAATELEMLAGIRLEPIR